MITFCALPAILLAWSENDYISSLIKKGEFSEALTLMDKSTFEPSIADKYKGQIYYGLYNPDSAIYYLEKTYRNGIQDDATIIAFSQALLWKKNFKDASSLLKQVQDKSDLDYLKVRANQHELLGELKDALKIYEKVIPAEELPYGTMERKAILLSWMKKFDASIALFDKIIDTEIVSEPLRVRCLVKKAEVIAWKKDFDTSIEILDAVVEEHPKNTAARFVKAQIFEWLGKYKDAKNLYKDILLVDKENVEAKWKLEKLLWVN